MSKKLALGLFLVFVSLAFFVFPRPSHQQTLVLAQSCQDDDGVCPQGCTPMNDNDCYFLDSFERDNVFNGNWELGGQERAENFTTDSLLSFDGSRSLKIHNAGASDGLQAINHRFSQPDLKGIASVAFCEFGDNRSHGSAFSVANSDISQYLIFEVRENQPNFVYRIQDNEVDSGVPRTPGWHILEFVVTEYGTYGKIDGLPLPI